MLQKVYKAVIYCRLSKEDGDKAESNSIIGQRAFCEEYVSRYDDIELVREAIIDDGVSGVSFERTGFKELEQELRLGKVDCIVVRDLSRFSRNYIDAGRYLEKIFPRLGVRFIAINDNYDSLKSDPGTDAFVLPFKNLINDTYCKDISVKIRSSLEIKRKNGEYVGAFCPFGYQRDPRHRHQLVVDEEAKEIVQMIFTLFKDGMSIGAIAKRLNQMGVLAPMEYKRAKGIAFETVFRMGDCSKWEYNTVKRILVNDVYIGVLTQGKRGTPNYKVRVTQLKKEEDWIKVEQAHEQLISYEDFNAVGELLKRDMRSLLTDEGENTLSGFLFCADCGATMVRKVVPSKNKKYIYYVCSKHKKHKNCSTHSVSAKEVEEKVCTVLHDQVELVVNLEKMLKMIEDMPFQNSQVFNYEKQIIKIQEELERYRNMKLRLYEDYTQEVITKEEYFEFRNTYIAMIEEKEKTLKQLKKECSQAIDIGSGNKNWVTLFKQYENVSELNRRVLMALVDRVKIYENHMIEIVFKYADEYEQTLQYLLNIEESKLQAVV